MGTESKSGRPIRPISRDENGQVPYTESSHAAHQRQTFSERDVRTAKGWRDKRSPYSSHFICFASFATPTVHEQSPDSWLVVHQLSFISHMARMFFSQSPATRTLGRSQDIERQVAIRSAESTRKVSESAVIVSHLSGISKTRPDWPKWGSFFRGPLPNGGLPFRFPFKQGKRGTL